MIENVLDDKEFSYFSENKQILYELGKSRYPKVNWWDKNKEEIITELYLMLSQDFGTVVMRNNINTERSSNGLERFNSMRVRVNSRMECHNDIMECSRSIMEHICCIMVCSYIVITRPGNM